MSDMRGSGQSFHSKEGVNHGNPLTTISYGIGILLLIHELCAVQPQVMHMWYYDDAGVGVTLLPLQSHRMDLIARGTSLGYFPEPTKIIMVVSLR